MRITHMALAGLVFIAPSLSADLVALIIASPAIIAQLIARRNRTAGYGEAGEY